MSFWMETFKIVRFKIEIIFCEIKKKLKWLLTVAEWQFTVAELIIFNVLKWEWVFSKINILIILRNENDQNCQNECKQTGPN